jgi:hypothetical protein
MTKVLFFCSLVAMTFIAAPQALRAAEAPCALEKATLHGTYISLHPTGYIVVTVPLPRTARSPSMEGVTAQTLSP